MNNYYQECMDKIMMFINNNQISEALKMIDEELSMIYIPKDFEEQLKTLRKEIQPKKIKENLSDEELELYYKTFLEGVLTASKDYQKDLI